MKKGEIMSKQQKLMLKKRAIERYKNGFINGMKGKKRPDLSEYNRRYKKGRRRGIEDPKKGKTYEEYYGIIKTKKLKSKRKNTKGKDNPNWKGGKSFEPYTFEFNKELKYAIKIRDNFICKICGNNDEERLSIHHIDYNKANNSPENLVTLCFGCNSSANGKRMQWKKYFQENLRANNNYIGVIEFERRCIIIANQIIKNKNIQNIYGVSRGGLIPAVRVSHLTKLPMLQFPNQFSAIIDEIIDSGDTKRRFSKYKYFYALVDKNKEKINEYINFFWEVGIK